MRYDGVVRLTLSLLLAAGCSFGSNVPLVVDATPDTPDAYAAPRCLDGRCRHKTITIDHTKIAGGPHLMFPLYVRISDGDFAYAQANGADFAFVLMEAPTQILAAERESFLGNELIAWVNIPTLSSTADTVLHLYYGDPLATDTQNRPAVWDADFQAVWHLGESTGGTNAIKDSTARANSGTDLGTMVLGTPGKLGPGARFDGVDDHIRVQTSAAFTPVYQTGTISLWVNWNDPTTTEYQRILLATNSFTGDGRGFEWGTNPLGDYYYYPEGAGGYNFASITSPFGDATWHHVAITQSLATKTVELYVDGTPRPPAFNGPPMNWNQVMTAAEWHWGGRMGFTDFAGMMDEIRVSKAIRSAGWIATEYANQNEPQTFYRVE